MVKHLDIAMLIDRKHIIAILAVMVFAVGLVSLLAWTSLKPIRQKNGFTRNHSTISMQLLYTGPKEDFIVSIAGSTEHTLYLKTKDPSIIVRSDLTLQDRSFIQLNVPRDNKLSTAFLIEVDSPLVHIMANNGPAVIRTDLNKSGTVAHKFPAGLFTRAVVISDNSYAFRGFDSTARGLGQIFIKGNPYTGEITRKQTLSTANSKNAGIPTDGLLSYDDSTHLLIYVSYYRNQTICLDTNLNIIHISKTIDTFANPQVDIGFQKGSFLTSTTPMRIINGKSHAWDGKLYNISKVKADNDPDENFLQNSTIDIYDVKTGTYIESFLIPYFEGEKIYDFRIFENKIIVLYKSNMVVYKLNYSNDQNN